MDRDTEGRVVVSPDSSPAGSPNDRDRATIDKRVLVVLCLGLILDVVNFAAAVPFFSEMARDLETTVSLLGQVTTGMTLLSAVLGVGLPVFALVAALLLLVMANGQTGDREGG